MKIYTNFYRLLIKIWASSDNFFAFLSLLSIFLLCTRWGYPCLAWVDQPAPPPPLASPHLNLRGLVFNFKFKVSVADFFSRTKSFIDIEDNRTFDYFLCGPSNPFVLSNDPRTRIRLLWPADPFEKPFLEICETRQNRRHSPKCFARTRQTRERQVLRKFGEFSECRLDRFIHIKCVIWA